MSEDLRGIDVFSKLIEIFSKTIKRDEKTKQHILIHGFSAYTPEPSNLELTAPTSEGKTYPVVEILKHFPKEDVWFLGGLSPTALAHDHGILVDEDGKSLEPEINKLRELYDAVKKEDKKKIKQKINELLRKAIRLVDLENKILVFLESPHPDTWARLRPILSHDVWETEYKFTDRERKSGPLKTIRVKIRGWPVAISCTTGSEKKSRTWEEKKTRFTTISPEMSREKYKEAVMFTFMRKGLPQAIFDMKIGVKEFEWAEKAIRTIRDRLLEIKEKARKKFGIPNPNVFWIPFYEDIGKEFPATIGRHMRDSSQRFITTLQMSAAINVFSRPILEIDGVEYIIVVREDYERAVKLYFEEDSETIFTGVPAHVLNFFKDVVLPLWEEKDEEGITVAEMVKKYFEVYKKTISSNTLRNHYLPYLENLGLMDKEPDPSDKRRNLWYVLKTKIVDENIPKNSLFENGCIFSLEKLKKQFSELKQIYPQNMNIIIRNYDGRTLTIEELWNIYYAKTSCGYIELEKEKGEKEGRKEEKYPFEKRVQSGVILQKFYNYVKRHGPVTLVQAIEFLASQGLEGEEKYKVLAELVDEGKVKQVEDKIGNILFVVSDTPVREEKEEGLSREEKIVLSVFLNLRKAGYEYVQWGDVELECKKYGLDPVTVNKTLRSLKDKGFIGDIVKNGVFYFYLSKTPPKPNLNNILGERSL